MLVVFSRYIFFQIFFQNSLHCFAQSINARRQEPFPGVQSTGKSCAKAFEDQNFLENLKISEIQSSRTKQHFQKWLRTKQHFQNLRTLSFPKHQRTSPNSFSVHQTSPKRAPRRSRKSRKILRFYEISDFLKKNIIIFSNL